nr:reverse transcriptase domain-containing protein [Tanacetum cinerariifolium]
MNYQPVVAGNQPNHNAGIHGNFNAGKVVKEAISAEKYMLLPLWSTGSKDPQNTNADADTAFNVKENENEVHVSPSSSDKTKKHDEKAKREDKGKSQVDLSTKVKDLRDDFEEFFVNSTNRVNAASAPVTAVGPNSTNSTNSFNAASPSDNADLATLCPNMVPNTEKLMEAFIGGLPRSIEGSVTALKPQTFEEAINIAQRLMD